MVQLVYVSASRDIFTPQVVAAILGVSLWKNARDNITGLLVYKSGSVIQFLEGPADLVRSLYATIERDPRHHYATRLYEPTVPARDFGDWTMGFRDLSLWSAARPEGYSPILEPDFDWSSRCRAVESAGCCRALWRAFAESYVPSGCLIAVRK